MRGTMMGGEESSKDVLSPHNTWLTVQSSESAIVSGTIVHSLRLNDPLFEIPGDLFYQSIEDHPKKISVLFVII